ncbi:MAG: molybdenum cofactor biosynthesis protein MoaE [Gammaproteobacteria bacterium]|nr:molybdenum cofactor biosynthesis protein MoaE [Gammaproteobacteria bacterium]
MAKVTLLDTPFNPEAAQLRFRSGRPDCGAVVSFLGQMRDLNDGESVQSMFLEHYPGMTEKALAEIIATAEQRWPVAAIEVIHRVGTLQPEEPIVLVLVAGTHRSECFRACEFVIDYLKTAAPFWKKEVTAAGEGRWVDERQSDHAASERWRDELTGGAPAATPLR